MLPDACTGASLATIAPVAPPPSVDDDLVLVERWRAGDRDAGEALFARHFDRVFRFFATKCADAADLTQQTFYALLKTKTPFAGRASFTAYLFTIARHELYRHFEQLRGDRKFDPEISSVAELVTTPGTRFDREAAHRRLLEAMRELPVEQQTLLELSYWEGLDAVEIGEVLGCVPATVRTRLHRARNALRDRMVHDGSADALGMRDELDAWAALDRARDEQDV
jgi:RNA polymerase sigma-70 factor (ECF subfamily)